jgi:hypothetical protein
MNPETEDLTDILAAEEFWLLMQLILEPEEQQYERQNYRGLRG